MHISEPEVRFEYLPVNKAFEENFLQALAECPSEESALKTQLVGTRQIPEPYNASGHSIYNDEIQADIKGYYKRIKLHF